MEDSKTNELENQEMTNTEDSKTNELEKQDVTTLEQDDLKDVSGGYVFYDSRLEDYGWEVINDKTLKVEGRYKNEKDAKRAAYILGQDCEVIKSRRKLERMRKKAKNAPRDNLNRGL